ncbi:MULTISPECIES: hypothetical protein [Flavobacterium]|uniref:hypothetical protein n=1 Tax=Flavobacterium TaxID=237 RepID=UPI0021139F02|nr:MULTISPECIES: hypothetical protein [Flavobacterium]UUF12523.1 hypothetical protein NLJ00_14805 [Flavobacterium panici]
MIDKDSKTKYARFRARLDFFILFIYGGLLIITLMLNYITAHEILNTRRADGSMHINRAMCAVLLISMSLFSLALYRIIRVCREAVFFINQVQISNKRLLLKGYRYDAIWEETLDIKNTQIEMLNRGKSRAPQVYYLQFTDELNLKYHINTSFYWSYTEILFLYRDLKKMQKQEIASVKTASRN